MTGTPITDKSHLRIHPVTIRKDHYSFVFYDSFFNNEMVYKIFDDRIGFKIAGIDCKKSYKTTKTGIGFKLSVTGLSNLKEGAFNLEPIEDEDLRIFYFETI